MIRNNCVSSFCRQLDGNQIATVEVNFMKKMSEMKTLRLDNNLLREIPALALDGASSLEVL